VREADGLTFGTVLAAAEKIRRSAPGDTKGLDDAQILAYFMSEP
jgi:hypothetical protein